MVFSAIYAVIFKVNIKYSNVDFVNAIKKLLLATLIEIGRIGWLLIILKYLVMK